MLLGARDARVYKYLHFLDVIHICILSNVESLDIWINFDYGVCACTASRDLLEGKLLTG